MIFDAGFWQSIGWSALTGVITSGLVASIVQVSFKARYDTKLESHKAQLSSQNQVDLERTRAAVAREAERFKQRHALFAEKQTEAVVTLFEALADLQTEMLDLLNPGREGGGEEEQFSAIQSRRFEANAYLRKKRLLLSSALAEKVGSFLNRFSSCEIRYRSRVAPWAYRSDRDEQEIELYAEVEIHLGERLREIELECRALLASEQLGT